MTKTIYEEIEAARKNRSEKIKDLRNKLAKAEADQAKAEADAAEALKAEKVEAYQAAKEAGRNAADAVEFFTHQIETAETAPLYSGEEKKAKADEIRANLDKLRAANAKKAAKLLKEAAGLIDEIRKESAHAASACKAIGAKDPIKLEESMALSGVWKGINNALNSTLIEPFNK